MAKIFRTLPREEAMTLLHYEPSTGIFRWRQDHGKKCKADKVAGTLNRGYIQIQINRRIYWAHRLAYLFQHGEVPNCDIDHIDGDRSNNRIANLRPASRSQNNWNSKVSRTNKSGVKGVSRHAQTSKWRASIFIKNKQIHLGLFLTVEAAGAAVRSARLKLHGDFANHG